MFDKRTFYVPSDLRLSFRCFLPSWVDDAVMKMRSLLLSTHWNDWKCGVSSVVTSARRMCWRTKVLQLVACICRTRAHYRKYISLIVSRNVDHVLSTLRLNRRQPSCYIETPSKEIVCVAMFFEPSFSKREKHNTIFLEAWKSVEQPFQRSNRLDVKYRRGIFVISRQTSKSC